MSLLEASKEGDLETVEMLLDKGANIHETPIIFVDRVAGESKMSRNIIMEAVWIVIRLKLSRIKRWFQQIKWGRKKASKKTSKKTGKKANKNAGKKAREEAPEGTSEAVAEKASEAEEA